MRTITMVAAALGILASAGTALARNPHCAGGIQYVVNGDKDKQKGNMEDYERQMNKAVTQLEICSTEDPDDFEAIGYLRWAYGELGNFEKAGEAFNRSIDGLEAKGDKKKAEWARTNRESYWANAFNAGIGSINTARELFEPYDREASADEKPLKEEATKNYEAAIQSLSNARALKPEDPQTVRNQGIA
jgi:tetratricopeptide (TPR) repeat protein